ncbi:prepilin-type N-terminal cleavage/methylation domain-containing protein [Clostridium sp. BL-8]|uniref:prepilin-type N-terminal cleavage/methylation domain-containing protein n=1 Tax=Clostridium sp. BL-8 TaxID=349938 RepID=UPI00098CBB88|nr:prepilin-type N-terminal cleavage/methylation domain-containing protein [Clostridium sp. BL-8]OOM71679.1 fimbrial protein precursor [Clostridium sp. BL-8]
MNSLLNKRKNELQTNKKKGFTLVELIIVIAIIAILVALAIPKFGAVIENSNQKADQATAKNIATIVAQKIADGSNNNISSGTVTDGTGDTLSVYDQLDGTKTPKAKAAKGASSFTYNIDSSGNITVDYTGIGEVYPSYNPATT